MSAMRKKSLVELVQDRVNNSTDTSAYKEVNTTSKINSNNSSIKTKVDSLYQKSNINMSTWDKVKQSASNIMNDSGKVASNFGLGMSSSAKNSLYYIQSASEHNFENYKRYNQFTGKLKEEEKELNERLSNKENENSKNKTGIDIINKFKNQGIENTDKKKVLLPQKQYESSILKGIDESIAKDEEKIQQNIEDSKTRVGKKVAELMPSIAQSTSGMVASAINPALGISYFQTSAGGSYTRDAKSKGMNDEQAMLYGSIMGAMESATESIGAKLTTGVGKSFFKDGAKEGLKAFGLDIAENFFEEAIMEPIQETVMQATGGTADWDNIAQRMWESGVNGALTSIIMGGASAGIGKATKIVTKIENGNQISQNEIVDTLKEINKSEEVDIEKLLVESFQFTAQDLLKNTDVQKNVDTKLENISSEISQSEAKEFKSIEEIDKLIKDSNLDDNVRENLKNVATKYNLNSQDVQSLIDNTKNGKYEQNQQTTIENKQVLESNQQITQGQNKIHQNEVLQQSQENVKNNIELTEENAKKLENKLKSEKYSSNESAKEFFKSAVENNLDISNEKIDALYDLPNARGIKTQVNTEIFKDDKGNVNKNINAIYTTDKEGNRSIIYNPKANLDTIIEKNAIHETFHDMVGTKEGKDVIDFVYNRIKDSTDFATAYDSLKETYAKAEDANGNLLYDIKSKEFENVIKEEAVADYLGKNLGTQEYINELVNGKESRNIAQKIYDAIVSFLDKVTGYKSEEAYLRGLKGKFEKAFNTEYNNQGENSKYSFAGINSEIANYSTLAVAENLEKQGKTAQEIFEQTGWYRGNENKWRYEIDDSNFTISDNIRKNTGYNLKNILQNADELYKAYPQLKDAEINFVELPANIAGGYNETFDSYIINNNMIDNTNELKKTLIHEIQHNIQAIEDFSRGSSDNWQETKTKLENKLSDIDKQIDNINNKIGFEDYKNKLLDEYFENNNFDSNEYFRKLEEFQNNSKYAEQIQRLKAQKKSIETTYGSIKNRDNFDLYQNTAGEQESNNAEKRLKMDLQERKTKLPFVKDEKTVYNIENRLPYEFKGNKYEMVLRREIVNGKGSISNNSRGKGVNFSRTYTDSNSSGETTNRERVYANRQAERSEGPSRRINEREGLSNIGGTSNKSRGLENNASSSFLQKNNTKLSQSTKGKWESFLEKHKINDGTRTTLGELKLPEAKRNLPTVQESQYQDAVNNATYIPKEEKANLLAELDGIKKNIKSLKEFQSIVEEMDNTYKQIDSDLLKKQTYNTGNKEIYQSYLKETKKYDMKAVNNALDLVKPNSQGRRTKEQWINVAKQIGTEITNKTNKEIQEIAFRSWQDLRPNSKDNLNRQGQKYVEFNSDDWVNTIYEEVENSRTRFSINEDKTNEMTLPGSKKIESHRVELPSNPTIYQDEDVRAFRYATDNIDNISQENNYAPPKPPDEELPDTKLYIRQKRTKQKTKLSEVLDSFTRSFVNKGHYIDKLAKQTKNNELKYKYDRTLSTFNEAQYSIGNEQVNSKGEVVGESLLDIFKPIEKAKLEEDFEDYLLNKHNISRTVAGKSIYGDDVSAPQSKKIVEKYEQKYPQFKEWSEKVNKYNQNTLKDMADMGMISQETYSNLRTMYSDYVPTYRDIVDEKLIFDDDNKVGGNALGKATKSNLEILSPKEAMAEQTLAVKKAIRMNELGVELYKTLGKGSKVFEGIDFDASAIQTLAGEVIQKAQDGSNTFTVFIDGQMTQFKISDELYTAFSKDTVQARIQNNKALNAVLTPVEKLSKAQRNLLTTYSIGFAINNPIKDIQDAVFNTKYSVTRFGKNYVKALYQIGTKGNIYKQYIRDGGSSNTYFEYNKGLLPEKNKIKKVIDKVKVLNETLEMAPRLAEYMSTLEKGGSKNEAMYNAAEITTNFKRGGDITKAMNKYGANFLNASVQGLDKQIRNITGENGLRGYTQLVARTAVLGILPSVLNHLILDDDEEYQDLPDYIKDSYYLIPSSKEDDKFIRIPKGRVLATIGTTARNMLELAEGERDVEEAITGSIGGVVSNMAPNNPITDNLIAPIIQAKNNKAWYDGEIESSRLQKLPVAERTDEKTDELSNKISEALQSNSLTKYIADKMGISPKKINYVIDQYSGGIGDVLLPMATPYAETNIFEDKFTTSSILKNKNVENFYTVLENAELSNNSEYATDTDKLEYKYLSTISKDVGELYSQKRKIQNSTISDNEKKKQTKEIQSQINNIAKKALNTLETATITSTTAKFNEIKYYKDEEGKWKEIKENDIPKGLSAQTYADYKNKLAVETDNKRKKENDDDINLASKEKANLLKSSTYTDKEKKKIYSEILGKSDEDYKYLSRLEDVNIDAYLDYKIQDIKADEDINSNVVGKTISGSKKGNLINYLNSSDLSDLDKIYILGKSSKLDSNQRAIIDDAIKNSDLTNEERKEFYKGLSSSNIEELKDGTIRWK